MAVVDLKEGVAMVRSSEVVFPVLARRWRSASTVVASTCNNITTLRRALKKAMPWSRIILVLARSSSLYDEDG